MKPEQIIPLKQEDFKDFMMERANFLRADGSLSGGPEISRYFEK